MGCHIDSAFVSAFIFADDILLLSANKAGLQSLVDICDNFASKRNLKFGTYVDPSKSKTKYIVFSKKTHNYSCIETAVLNGHKLPSVDKVTHLRIVIEFNNSMKTDMALKR